MFASLSNAGRSMSPPPLLALLEPFYRRMELPIPRATALDGSDLPEPYRHLLVHSRDMTPTLEAFHRQSMRIAVLGRWREQETYFREVLLKTEKDGRPVEYGLIRIQLERLPSGARQAVLEEEVPLGRILQTEAIPHLSWPQAFFRVEPDFRLSSMLGLNASETLYGRLNLLLNGSRALLAEVLEVLPPAD